MSQFSNVSAYCLYLKSLADQLANVGAPVTNQRLVLQLIKGLPRSYNDVATSLEQLDPLPSFYLARSRLILHETRHNHQASHDAINDSTTLYSAQHTAGELVSPSHSTSCVSHVPHSPIMRGGPGRNRGGRRCGSHTSYCGGRGMGSPHAYSPSPSSRQSNQWSPLSNMTSHWAP